MITKIRHSTFNCRGLNNLTDILKLNDILKKEKICHLQETNISKKENKEKLLLYLKEFDVFYDLTASESKGVAIIVKKSLKYKIVNIHFYSERIIMLKIEIFDTTFNFVNIYSPNSIEEQISFVEMITNLISGLKNVILSGDFNYDKLNLLKSNYNCAHQTVLVAIKKVQDAISIYYKQKRLGIEKRACETNNNFIFRPTKVLISKEIDTQKSNQITNFKINEKTSQDIKLIMEELEFFYKNLLEKERVSITKLNDYSFFIKKTK